MGGAPVAAIRDFGGQSQWPCRRQRASAEAEVGVRISKRRYGLRPADRRRPADLHRQRYRLRLLARCRRPAASIGRFTRARECARRRRLSRLREPARQDIHRVFWRHARERLCASMLATGKQIWMQKLSDHYTARITGAPSFYRRSVVRSDCRDGGGLQRKPTYPCCTFRGSVVALDAVTGSRCGERT